MAFFTFIGAAICGVWSIAMVCAAITNIIKWLADTDTLHARLDLVNEHIVRLDSKKGKK